METLPSYTAEAHRPANSDTELESYSSITPVQTLQLLHVNRKLQTFSFPPGTSSFQYSIQVNDSSGLIKKPDLIIARESGTLEKIGEGRFEKYGPGTTIKYIESGMVQDLQLESSLSQRFMITVDGRAQWWWQPSRSNKYVAEVVTAGNELMGLFTYSGDHVLVGRDVKDDTVLGLLEIDMKYANQQSVLDRLVSMTVLLVERARRRGRNLHGADGTSPLATLAASAASGGVASGPVC